MTAETMKDTSSPSRILIIDDDTVSRTLLKEILLKAGYCVEEAGSGEAGLALVEKFNPELVMLDVLMPGMNGYEVSQHLRKNHNYNDIFIIMLTGLNDIKSVDEAFEAGANDFITKPINWPLLEKRVRYAIRDREIQRALAQNEARLLQAQRIAKLAYWQLHKATQRMEFSAQFYEQFSGHTFTISNYNTYIEHIHPDDRTHVEGKFTEAYSQCRPVEFDHRAMINGATFYFHINIEPQVDKNGSLISLNGTIQNITQQRNTEALIEYQKYHDDLTGLPNRKNIKRQLEKILATSTNKDEITAVLAIGLMRFKEINDSLGHHGGDMLLRTIAERLNSAATDAICGYYDTETFIFIMKDIQTVANIEQRIDAIFEHLQQPYHIAKQEIYIDCRTGISIYPIEDETADTLLANALLALNSARDSVDTKVCFHSPMMNQRASQLRTTETLLRKAIQNDQLRLFYQPQIELHSGQLVGAEALLRLQLDDGSFMSPLDFIPVAEETGLIIPIGYWIFDTACRQLRDWLDSGIKPLRIGINLSARQFIDQKLNSSLEEAVREYNIPGRCIDLEITESIALHNINRTIDILQSFKQRGYTISLDDFGTGYSSLSSLHLLPIDVLKIDRAFIKDIGPDGQNSTMARTIINMAHNLNLSVIAEGAEDEHHIEFLKANGCDEVQGFYYSRPLSAEAFSDYCRNYLLVGHPTARASGQS